MQKKTFSSIRTAGSCLIMLVLLAFLAACGGSTTTGGSPTPTATTIPATSTPTTSASTPTPTATSSSGGANSVSIHSFSFSPATLSVSVGTKVTWTNNDSVTHTVTADQGAWDSGDLSPGSSFSFTFTKAGTYTYHCKIHPFMKATIVVK